MARSTSFPQSSTELSYPPLDGSLFPHEMLEFNATRNPNHPMFIFWDEDINSVRSISHLEFYRTCQRIAHTLRPNRQGQDYEVVAIIANCDTILYHALFIGLIYAGLVPFPMSPRNSAAAVVDMLQKTGCKRLITTSHSLASLLDGIRTELTAAGKTPLQIEDLPTLVYAYPDLANEIAGSPFVPYPKAKDRPAGSDVMYYLHSSGSTGFPKPIPITYLIAVHWCITPVILEHVDSPLDLRVCVAALPSFHTLGVYVQLLLPIASLKPVSVYAPTSYHDSTAAPIIPNAANTLESVQLTKANVLVVVPTFLEEWVSSPQSVKSLSALHCIAFGGGPLAKMTGEALVAAGVKLSSVYGATEFCAITHMWVPQGDGTYECQVLTCETHQVSVENLPDVKGYASSDAFIKHPTVEGLYKVVGRLDDVLIHSSGEKTVPAPMESIIGSSRFVSGVCLFGRGRNQVGVLDEKQVAEFRNKLWPEAEEANKDAPTFSRIFKEMILLTSQDKPMRRAGKGTVMKKATMKLYETEIDALYESMEASARAGVEVPIPSSWTQSEVEDWLLAVERNADLFEQGFDSLSATFLKNRIIGSLGASPIDDIREAALRIHQNIVFTNPTLRSLARCLIKVVVDKDDSSTPDIKAGIEDMIEKYSVGLGKKAANGVPTTRESYNNGHVVLLTGTTGGLGSYLLASLLDKKDVVFVYAFNRPSRTGTVKQRQRSAFEDRGLDNTLLDSEKLVYVEGDTSLHNLGLDKQLYEEIRSSVTVIIHNAWRLDFNLSLSSFEPHVKGTRNLMDLALASGRSTKPRFLFTSSVASAQCWDKSKGAFPEEVQFDAGVAAGAGYGASKYVCERLLVNSGLPGSSFRIGQVTGGPPRGAWSITDWVPIIVKSSVVLGGLPEARGVTSWLPPHAVLDAILDVAFAEEEPPIAVNLVHPHPVEWESLMKPISDALYQKKLTKLPLPLLSFAEWLEMLEKYAAVPSEENIRRVPAIKLLNFIRSLTQEDVAIRQSNRPGQEAAGFTSFATDVAQKVSRTMKELEPITPPDVTRWVDYWESAGMFSS
ncbi:putative aminoadipate reductase [Phlebopus sp. FC_14]|nr:putative aminoadipate reductase [Phlebopus sp. FC_14]